MSNAITSIVSPSPAISNPDRALLSKNESAFALGVSVRTIHAMILDGRLRSVRVGTRRLIRRDDLLAFIEANTVASAA